MVKKAASKTTKKPTGKTNIETDGFGPSTVRDEVVLEVKNLQTNFTTKWGTVKACDGISYSVKKYRVLQSNYSSDLYLLYISIYRSAISKSDCCADFFLPFFSFSCF